MTDKGREAFDKFVEEKIPDCVVVMERPPVLWRHNTSAASIGGVYRDNKHVGKKQHRVTGVNTGISAMFNMDYDGDNVSIFAISSEDGKAAAFASSIEGAVEFEHNTNIIASPEHEAIFAAYMLSIINRDIKDNEFIDTIFIDSFQGLKGSISILNKQQNIKVVHLVFGEMTYFEAIINKALNTEKYLYQGEILDDRRRRMDDEE